LLHGILVSFHRVWRPTEASSIRLLELTTTRRNDEHEDSPTDQNYRDGLLHTISVVPRDRIGEEYVVFDWSSTDVMDDQGMIGSGRPTIRDDSYMRQISRQHPSYQIAWQVCRLCACPVKLSLGALKEFLKIWNAAMVDIRVWLAQTPDWRIEVEVRSHVLMNQRLQIDTNCPVGTNDDIRAHTSIRWNIAHWIRDARIGAIVDDGVASLFASCVHQLGRVRSGYRCSQKQECDVKPVHAYPSASNACHAAWRRQ
jgi:hypothetical protein